MTVYVVVTYDYGEFSGIDSVWRDEAAALAQAQDLEGALIDGMTTEVCQKVVL